MNRSAVPALSTLAVLLAVLLAGVPAAPVFQPNAELNERFERFKSQFEKSYADAAEELRRREIWEKNVAAIDLHNAEFKEGKHTFTITENRFADMTQEEVNQFFGAVAPARRVAIPKMDD